MQIRESAGFAGLFSAQTAQQTPEIQQVFPVFSALFERKIAPAKLLGTAKREILASGKATGAGILAMYSEYRQRRLAREDPFCGCRIPNLHTLKRPLCKTPGQYVKQDLDLICKVCGAIIETNYEYTAGFKFNNNIDFKIKKIQRDETKNE